MPFSVKVRIAASAREVNVREVVSRLRDSGAAAVTIHGRTADARYSKSADWSLIADVVDEVWCAFQFLTAHFNGVCVFNFHMQVCNLGKPLGTCAIICCEPS